MTDVREIKFRHRTWSSSSGELPYDYALMHAWLSMLEQQHGQHAEFAQFFTDVPKGMFAANHNTQPIVTPFMVSGCLDAHAQLLFTANQTAQYLGSINGSAQHGITQTVITLSLVPADQMESLSFSTVIFNASDDNSDHSQTVSNWGTEAMTQARFKITNKRAEQLFRSAVMPLKLADHPLLKHYQI